MGTVVMRLEFNHIFEEECKEPLDYLMCVSKNTLNNLIGFFTTEPIPNYDTFFSNPDIKSQIIKKVDKFLHENESYLKPSLITTEGNLLISELIVSNKKKLILNNTLPKNEDRDELNLFKAFLSINQKLNQRNNLFQGASLDNLEQIAEMLIASKFPSADYALGGSSGFKLLKLSYVTSYKFHKLINFLSCKDEYTYLLKALCIRFNQPSIESLIKQVDNILLHVIYFHSKQVYKFFIEEEDENTKNFLESLRSDNITIVADFLNFREHPLYKIDKNTYSIINPYFIIDKFTKSVKFTLKEAFNEKNDLKPSDRRFFNFYNKKFSEEFLMKNLLEDIFYKKYYKKNEGNGDKNKPDFYLRHNKNIYLFEYKDILINKDIRTSGDINKILEMFKSRFLVDGDKKVGIGQLITHIELLSKGLFEFDPTLNLKKNHTVYPILLLSDRLLELHGINYIFNKWFHENLSTINKKINVQDLIVIDIDTLIFYKEYLKEKDNNFKKVIIKHIKYSKIEIKGYGDNLNEIRNSVEKKLMKKLAPFSYRFEKTKSNKQIFIDRFKNIMKF